MTFKEELGARIRKARLDAGMTQSDVAKRVHTVISCVSNWETGKRNPGIEQLSILSQIFGIPIGDLVPFARYEEIDEDDQLDIFEILEKINENEDEDQA
jgi:transcriptional regulator with XRE-family HTH domain